MKTRLQEVLSQKKRDDIRKWIGLRILLILMVLLVIEEAKALAKPNIIFIDNVEARTTLNPLPVSTQNEERADNTVSNSDDLALSQSESETGNQSSSQSVVQMIKDTFPEVKNDAVAVAMSESRLDISNESWIDRMSDNRAFSIGLFQINLTQHEIEGIKCYEAFQGRNKYAKVINEELYQKCVKMAKDPQINLKKAKEIYVSSGNSFKQWGGYTSGGFRKFL